MWEENNMILRNIINNIKLHLTGLEMKNIRVTEAIRKFKNFYEESRLCLPKESQAVKMNLAKSLFQSWLYFKKHIPREQILLLSESIFKSESGNLRNRMPVAQRRRSENFGRNLLLN